MTLLEFAIDKGWIFVRDGLYLGHTQDADACVVIGALGDEINIERYLTDHPTPEYW